MTTQIQTTAAMRRFNLALQRGDRCYRLVYGPGTLPDPGLEQLHDWLIDNECDKTALELKLAGEAVGYFKE